MIGLHFYFTWLFCLENSFVVNNLDMSLWFAQLWKTDTYFWVHVIIFRSFCTSLMNLLLLRYFIPQKWILYFQSQAEWDEENDMWRIFGLEFAGSVMHAEEDLDKPPGPSTRSSNPLKRMDYVNQILSLSLGSNDHAKMHGKNGFLTSFSCLFLKMCPKKCFIKKLAVCGHFN